MAADINSTARGSDNIRRGSCSGASSALRKASTSAMTSRRDQSTRRNSGEAPGSKLAGG
jgi:hypothetical protein